MASSFSIESRANDTAVEVGDVVLKLYPLFSFDGILRVLHCTALQYYRERSKFVQKVNGRTQLLFATGIHDRQVLK